MNYSRWRSASIIGFSILVAFVGCDEGSTVKSTPGIGPDVSASASGGAMAETGDGSMANGTGDAASILPATPSAWQPSAACVEEVQRRVANLSLELKAGQMVQADSANTAPSVLLSEAFGSMLSGAGSDPPDGDDATSWSGFVFGYLNPGPAPAIPILYGIDAVHGNNNVSGAVIFPHNIGLGCTRNPVLVEEIGRITALEMRGMGANWAFAPVTGPGRDERWGRIYETFSETPALAAQMAVAAIRGLQGSSLVAKTSVLACGKHFAGDGATDGGRNEGNSTLGDIAFQRIAVDGYQPAINSGLGSIMVSYSSFQGTKLSAHAPLLTETLKGRMGFKGFLISDWAAVQQLSSQASGTAPTGAALALAINAGLDMIMEPYAPTTVRDLIVAATTKTNAERIPEERIDDAVRRILTVKCEMGMLEPDYDSGIDPTLTAQIGSAEHRAVARQAVRESLVLLQNRDNVLPLPKSARILLAGTAADNKAKQCGGWTVNWQGLGAKPQVAGIAGGAAIGDTTVTTIRQGIESVLGPENVTYAVDAVTAVTGMTHVVVVVGESPYAESAGDRASLTLSAVSAADVTAIGNATKLGLPVVVIVVSGRPIIIADQMSKADAWVAAWLPGSEGDGVADVLFGDFAPTGKLSHSWPANMAQIPINLGDTNYETDPPQFGYGFGLTY